MFEILLAIPLGLATGAILGLLGVGGSVLTVPALVYLLDQPVDAATTAALFIVSANAAVGAAANARHGTLNVRLAAGFAAASVPGALLGTYLSSLAEGETVLFLMAVVMLASAWFLWKGRPDETAAGTRAGGTTRGVAVIATLGVSVGVLTGFFGVGGGFLIVPALVLLLGVPMRLAVGTSLAIISVTALVGLTGHLVTGGLSFPVTLVLGGAGTVGVLLAARYGRRVPTASLSRAFAVLLVGVAVFLVLKNVAVLGV